MVIIIIFAQMIIRKVARMQLQAAAMAHHISLTNTSLPKTLMGPGLIYNFSEQPGKPQENNDKHQKRGRQFKNRPKDIFNRSFEFKLKKQLAQRGILNYRIWERYNFLSKILKYCNPFNSKNPNVEFKEITLDMKTIFFYFSLALLAFILLPLNSNKMAKKSGAEQAKSVQINKSSMTQSQEIGSQKLEELIAGIKKIKITTTSFLQGDAEEDMQKEVDQKQIYPRKLVSYTIVMEDRNGKQYVADPYQGDPNNFLKYVEYVQEKYHTTDKADVIYQDKHPYTFQQALSGVSGFLFPFLPVVISIYIFRKTDPTSLLKNFGKGAKQFKIEAMKDIKTRFADVAGMQQAKKEITQFVDFLKHNQKYIEIGAKIPKGALLTGPPGTGKTMLARACAGEAGVSFFYISGSEFVEVFVGLGASKVRDLFAKARQNAPSIIFIDEIDAIGKKRQNSRNEEKDTTLNQLLVEMDGFSSSETIIVLAATNRKEILDNALTRPGRFDRMVEINLPDVKAREQIFMVHLAPLKIDPSVEMRTIAKRLSELSPGFSGADIANLCNEAAIIATRKNREFIVDKDFEEATERITAGYVKKGLMKEKTKKRVAYHEAGHAVASWFLKGGDPLVKLTIIPRSKGALGYAQYLPKTSYIMARNQIIDKIAIMLGGITTEEIFFGQISSGGSDDLQKVYSLTRRMVTQFGMGEETYNMTMDEESYIQKQSTFLSNKMEEEVNKILQEARKRSREIIEEKKDIIQALAKELMEKETLNSEEILKVMGQRPTFQPLPAASKAQLVV